MKIRDNKTGEIFNYGSDGHHALSISKNGGFLTFENLQNGDGSLENGCGGYSFVLDDGKTPEESDSKEAMYGATYANIGGFNIDTLENILQEIEGEIAEIIDCSDSKSRMLARHWNNCINVVEKIIKKHLSDDNDNKCSECSRRKFYLSGYKDGKKENGDWIPVKPDNLPDIEVLCCDNYGEMLIGYMSSTEEGYICDSEECTMYDVVAWMSLPKPYIKEGE